MKALTFNRFISEARELTQAEESAAKQFGETAKKLEYLMKVGLIDDSGYFKEIQALTRATYKFVKGLGLNPREEQDLEMIKKIGSDTGLAALNSLNTPGAQALIDQGLHLVSSPTQIANGTLVWSIDPNYRPSNGWGIGFFPGIRAIRRMTPKGVDLGVRWQPGSMDIVIKKWRAADHSSALDFYDKAMQWAAENIDFEDVKLKPEPQSWKYYTKRTTGRRPQFNQEVHDMQLQVDNLLNTARERRFSGYPIAAHNFLLSAWTIKKKIGEIENDREKIADAEDAIFRIKQDIEKLKNEPIMRIIESFGGWNLMKLDESTKAAKEYMFQRAARKMRKMPEELTPEERDEILTDPKYLELVEVAKAYPNYLTALLKFVFDHRASIEDIQNLLQTMQIKKNLIAQLGSPQDILDDYANREPKNGISGFEQLTDAIRTIERMKEAKWFIDAMPRSIRDQFRALSLEEQQPFVTAAVQMQDLGEDAIRRFFGKIKAFDGKPISDVAEYISRYLKGFSNLDMQKKIQDIENLEPEAGIIYSDDKYLVMSVRTEKAQKDLCAVANWCINRGSFSSYASDAVQLNIFNFGTDSSDPLFLTGTTVYYTGKVRTAHDINDAAIKRSDDPAEHFTKLGYPAEVVSSIINELPREMMVKKVVYDLKLDKNKPIEVLFNIIKQSYSIDPETKPESLDIVLDIVRTRIKEGLTKDEVIKMYSEYGVLSKFSAMLVKELLGDASSEEMQGIIDSTLRVFATVNQIAKDDPSLLFPQVKNVLAQEQDVLRELGLNRGDVEAVMESITGQILDEFAMAEPMVKPRTAPTIAPSRPMPKRPGPVPSKRPFKEPEPAKAEAEDVIDRYEELTKNQEEE